MMEGGKKIQGPKGKARGENFLPEGGTFNKSPTGVKGGRERGRAGKKIRK